MTVLFLMLLVASIVTSRYSSLCSVDTWIGKILETAFLLCVFGAIGCLIVLTDTS